MTKALVMVGSALSLGLAVLRAQSPDPQFTSDGQLVLPENYREWVCLGSGLGMSYGLREAVSATLGGEEFDNVFVTPQAYKAFLVAVLDGGALSLSPSLAREHGRSHG